MQQYNVFQAIYMSFYSKNLYRDVAENWGGKTFLYLLLVLALSWVVLTIQLQVGINHGYNKYSDRVTEQVPVLTIKDGELSTPENRPYIITNPENQEKIAIIDASGQYTTLDQAKTPLLVTKTAVLMQSDPNEIKTYQISKTLTMQLDPPVVNSYLKTYLGFLWIPFFIFFLFGSFIYRIIESLIYAVIGKVFGLMTSRAVTYGQCVQIAMVAITPAIVVATILDIFIINFNHQGFLYFVLAMIYLCFGVLANKKRM